MKCVEMLIEHNKPSGRRRGSVIVEGAFSILIFLTLFLTSLDLGVGFFINLALDNSSVQGANLLSSSGTIPQAESLSKSSFPGFAQYCLSYEVVGWNNISGSDFATNGVELAADTNLIPGMGVSYTVNCNWNWLTPLTSIVIGNRISFAKQTNIGIR